MRAGAGVISQGTELPPPPALAPALHRAWLLLGDLCGRRLVSILTENPYGYSDRLEQGHGQAPWGGPWGEKTSQSKFAQTLREPEELRFTQGTPLLQTGGAARLHILPR